MRIDRNSGKLDQLVYLLPPGGRATKSFVDSLKGVIFLESIEVPFFFNPFNIVVIKRGPETNIALNYVGHGATKLAPKGSAKNTSPIKTNMRIYPLLSVLNPYRPSHYL